VIAMPRRKPKLSLVVPVPGKGRPKPPASLDTRERKAWQAIVASLPDYWIDQAGEMVLRRLCAQVAIAEELEDELRRLRAQEAPDGEVVRALAAAHAERAKVIAHLLGQLRATPKSRAVSRAAGPKIEAVPSRKPWEA
jgi:hypothetical protein